MNLQRLGRFYYCYNKYMNRDQTSKWTYKQLENLATLYPISSWEELLKAFPFSTKRSIMSTANIHKIFRPRASGHNIKRCHKEDLFDIWTEESAYILGYLEADGYIKFTHNAALVQFAVSSKDKDYLLALHKIVGSDNIINTWNNCNWKKKKHYACRYMVTSRRWKPFLEKYYRKGCIPKDLPKDLVHHYIRGYFDGDGSIFFERQCSKYKSNFVFATKELAQEFAGMLRPVLSSKLSIHRKTNSLYCWHFNISYMPTVLLGEYLYKDASIFLDRKKALFDITKERFKG